jgi:hypothetical protein
MVKDWCSKASTWDNTLATMKGGEKPSKKEKDHLIALMLGVGVDMPSAPEPMKTRLSKEAVDECIAAVNATLVIPHLLRMISQNTSPASPQSHIIW